MNEECEAVTTALWAEAPTAGWPPSLRSEIFNVRRRCAPSSHVSNERTQNPMAGKIRDDWWVWPSHGEVSGLRKPRFWIRVFLLLDRLPAKANEPCLPTHTHTHAHTHTQPFYGSLDSVWDNPSELVAEETFTHSHLLRSSVIPYLLPPWHPPCSIVCLIVFFHNLSPTFPLSTSWPGTLNFIVHTFLQPIIVFFSQHMPIPSQPVLL